MQNKPVSINPNHSSESETVVNPPPSHEFIRYSTDMFLMQISNVSTWDFLLKCSKFCIEILDGNPSTVNQPS